MYRIIIIAKFEHSFSPLIFWCTDCLSLLIQETCRFVRPCRFSRLSASTSNTLLCPNHPFSTWDPLGCLESIVLRRKKRTDPCQKELWTVCITDHFRNTKSFVVATGCKLSLLQRKTCLFVPKNPWTNSTNWNPALPQFDFYNFPATAFWTETKHGFTEHRCRQQWWCLLQV